MSSSAKDNYIRDVISRIDNLFVKNRMKKELAAHFDDVLASMPPSDPLSLDKVIQEMGDPKEIADSANQGNPSLSYYLRTTFKQTRVAILLMLVCLMSVGLFMLNDRLSQAQTRIDHLSNQIDNLGNKVKQIDTLRTQLAQLENGNEMTFLLAQNYNQATDLFRPINASYIDYSTPTDQMGTTTLRPLSLPVYIHVFRRVPDSIRIEENFGIIRFVYQTDKSSIVFCTVELKTTYQLRTLRGFYGVGELRLISSDIDLNNGLFIVETAAVLDDTGLTDVQVNEIHQFLRFMSVRMSNDYPSLVINP